MPNRKKPVTDCWPDVIRLAAIRECMESYGQEGHKPGSEWPWNCLSTKAVVYSCGAIAREGDAIEHCHDPDELKRCMKLSAAAAELMDGCEVGMGSESGDPFRPFFVATNINAEIPAEVTEAVIRTAFGGTIYPMAEIVIEPLRDAGQWWDQVEQDGEGDEDYLRPWRALIAWFHTQKDLHSPAFVMIGEDPLSDENGGCVFPRLAVALTDLGSLVGIGGYVVHT